MRYPLTSYSHQYKSHILCLHFYSIFQPASLNSLSMYRWGYTQILCQMLSETTDLQGSIPDSKVHGTNMSAPDGPHVGPMNLAIRDDMDIPSLLWDDTTSMSVENHTRVEPQTGYLNPLCAKFFRGNKNIYLHFVSLFHIDITQVVEILPQVRQGTTYPT